MDPTVAALLAFAAGAALVLELLGYHPFGDD